MRAVLFIIILLLLVAPYVSADSWAPPKSQTVYSENSQFKFSTLPNWPSKSDSSCAGRLEERRGADNRYSNTAIRGQVLFLAKV
jgi:hypothetical protein